LVVIQCPIRDSKLSFQSRQLLSAGNVNREVGIWSQVRRREVPEVLSAIAVLVRSRTPGCMYPPITAKPKSPSGFAANDTNSRFLFFAHFCLTYQNLHQRDWPATEIRGWKRVGRPT